MQPVPLPYRSKEYEGDLHKPGESGEGGQMEAKFTWRAVLWTGAKDTWTYFRARLHEAAKSVALLAASALAVWVVSYLRRDQAAGATAVREMALDYAQSVLVVAVAWVVGVFLWKLWMAPVRLMERGLAARLDTLEENQKHYSQGAVIASSEREHMNTKVQASLDRIGELEGRWKQMDPLTKFHDQGKLLAALSDIQSLPPSIERINSLTEELKTYFLELGALRNTDLNMLRFDFRKRAKGVHSRFEQIQAEIQKTTGTVIDIESAPTYERNPGTSFQGDDVFGDDVVLHEFRRLSSRSQNVQAQTKRAVENIGSRINKAATLIEANSRAAT